MASAAAAAGAGDGERLSTDASTGAPSATSAISRHRHYRPTFQHQSR